MKRILLIMLIGLFTTNAFSLTSNKIRLNARFLSDRMAYELDLTPMQYEYCYEINYDFIYSINRIMDDVVFGYIDAIDAYYDQLDIRNEDLRYVLNAVQYAKFRTSEYFYNPVYSTGSTWNFRVYTIYSNNSFFYYDSPSNYKKYVGGHSHKYYSDGYYRDRINHGSIGFAPQVQLQDRRSAAFGERRKADFGVNTRQRNEPIRYNNYNNENQRNRTRDNRYRDNSGNRYSPSINTPTAPQYVPPQPGEPQQPAPQPPVAPQQPVAPNHHGPQPPVAPQQPAPQQPVAPQQPAASTQPGQPMPQRVQRNAETAAPAPAPAPTPAPAPANTQNTVSQSNTQTTTTPTSGTSPRRNAATRDSNTNTNRDSNNSGATRSSRRR